MTKIAFPSVLVIIFIPNVFSQQLQCVKAAAAYDFWLYLPEKNIMESKPPVLIFLHGRNLCGSNLKYLTEGKTKGNVKKPAYGAICEIKNRGKNFPAIVVGPQFPEGSSWEPDKLLTVLNYIQQKYDTDTSRVYVTGMSAGGFGTLHFAGKYPDRVTAAAALCGGGNIEDACNLSQIPLWLMCGTDDSKYFVTQSKEIASAIRRCNGGPLLRFNMLSGQNHSDMEKYFRTTDTLYNWLFSQRKISSQKETEFIAKASGNNSNPASKPETGKNKKHSPFYIVSVMAVSKENKAKAMAADLKKKGYPSGYLWIPDYASLSGKKLYSVYIGTYATQNECEAATEELRKVFPDAFGTEVSQNTRNVYITGIGKVATTQK